MRAKTITGYVLNGLFVAFMFFDMSIKLMQDPEAIKGTNELGFTQAHLLPLGLIQLTLLVLFLIPTTAVLGAVLWTGYLGGAIATHFRLYNPLFSHVLFPIYVAALMWGGLYLRDARVRQMVGAKS